MAARGWRGNLRENREDPAPTVGGERGDSAIKDAYDRPLVGGMKGARFGHWWRWERDGRGNLRENREDSPAHRPKTIPASPSMPIAPYRPAKIPRSRHMAKRRARAPQCRSSQSPRPPPTVGAGSSRFLAKIPPPTAPKRFPPARPCPSPPIAPQRYSVRGIWPKGAPVRRNADHRNRRVRPDCRGGVFAVPREDSPAHHQNRQTGMPPTFVATWRTPSQF